MGTLAGCRSFLMTESTALRLIVRPPYIWAGILAFDVARLLERLATKDAGKVGWLPGDLGLARCACSAEVVACDCGVVIDGSSLGCVSLSDDAAAATAACC